MKRQPPKKKKKRSTISETNSTKPIPVIVIPPTPKNKICSFLNKYKWVITVVSFILLVITSYIVIREYTMSPREKFERDNIKRGKIKAIHVRTYGRDTIGMVFSENPPEFYFYPMVEKYQRIRGLKINEKEADVENLTLQIGENIIVLSFKDLHNGVQVPIFNKNKCRTSSSIWLIVKDDRIYMSAFFYDFETGIAIGAMEYNHWRLYKDTYLDYADSDNQFEVVDKKGFVVCSISTNSVSTMKIAGYYIDNSSIWILGNNWGYQKMDVCISKSDSLWKVKAEPFVRSVTPVLIK